MPLPLYEKDCHGAHTPNASVTTNSHARPLAKKLRGWAHGEHWNCQGGWRSHGKGAEPHKTVIKEEPPRHTGALPITHAHNRE